MTGRCRFGLTVQFEHLLRLSRVRYLTQITQMWQWRRLLPFTAEDRNKVWTGKMVSQPVAPVRAWMLKNRKRWPRLEEVWASLSSILLETFRTPRGGSKSLQKSADRLTFPGKPPQIHSNSQHNQFHFLPETTTINMWSSVNGICIAPGLTRGAERGRANRALQRRAFRMLTFVPGNR